MRANSRWASSGVAARPGPRSQGQERTHPVAQRTPPMGEQRVDRHLRGGCQCGSRQHRLLHRERADLPQPSQERARLLLEQPHRRAVAPDVATGSASNGRACCWTAMSSDHDHHDPVAAADPTDPVVARVRRPVSSPGAEVRAASATAAWPAAAGGMSGFAGPRSARRRRRTERSGGPLRTRRPRDPCPRARARTDRWRPGATGCLYDADPGAERAERARPRPSWRRSSDTSSACAAGDFDEAAKRFATDFTRLPRNCSSSSSLWTSSSWLADSASASARDRATASASYSISNTLMSAPLLERVSVSHSGRRARTSDRADVHATGPRPPPGGGGSRRRCPVTSDLVAVVLLLVVLFLPRTARHRARICGPLDDRASEDRERARLVPRL